MIRRIRIALMSLLSAGILTFCAPSPATAGEYVDCARVSKDANTLYNLMQVTPTEEGVALIAELRKTSYGRVVVSVAVDAAKSDDAPAHIRAWHTACLKLTT